MKVVQIVPSIGEESSGPSYSVPGLCRGLMSAGCDVALHFGGEMPARVFEYPVRCYPVSSFPHPRMGRSPEMLKGLIECGGSADVIHNNSLWMYSNVYGHWAIRELKRKGLKVPKLVNAPRGTLAVWSLKHHRLQKKLFGWYAQNAALAATDMWHATCEKEYEEIRAQGYRQPVAIVPVGIEVPSPKSPDSGGDGRRKVVFFGRLHQVKAVDRLVQAWERLTAQGKREGWELVIAGPDGGVRNELEGYVAEKKIPKVSFVGEINGPSKYEFLSAADIYVLPSHTENFGVTVAEALSCGTPVVVSQGTPWKDVEKERCGKWVVNDVDSLAAAMGEMMGMTDDERWQMGEQGREWMKRDFSWEGIGAKMKAAYEWLLGKGEKPEWVMV